MTRENKIALVIGFAILLVVGVLLSDHLAQTMRGDAANLARAVDPTVTPAGAVEFKPLVVFPKPTPAAPAQPEPAPIADAPATATTHITSRPHTHPLHEVRRGETLAAIARTYYGTTALSDELATFNGVPDPTRLQPGLRLQIPERTLLGATSPAPSAPVITLAMHTYTVQSGDTLSELAQKLMGTARKTNELWTLNKTVMTSPDDLKPGMKLQYPGTP